MRAAARSRLGPGASSHDDTAVLLARWVATAQTACSRSSHSPARVKVSWDVASNAALYGAEQQFSTDVANAMGGAVAFNPLW